MTRANLAVWLGRQGSHNDSLETWRMDDVTIRESADWLIARLPAPPDARSESAGTSLAWFRESRVVELRLETPQRVAWRRADLVSRTEQSGDYLVAMNIGEIADLVTWCLQGRS